MATSLAFGQGIWWFARLSHDHATVADVVAVLRLPTMSKHRQQIRSLVLSGGPDKSNTLGTT